MPCRHPTHTVVHLLSGDSLTRLRSPNENSIFNQPHLNINDVIAVTENETVTLFYI